VEKTLAYKFNTNIHPVAILTEEDFITPNLEESKDDLCQDDLKLLERELKGITEHVTSVKRLVNESPDDSLAFIFDDGSILIWSPGWQDLSSETEILFGYVLGEDVEEFIQRKRDELLKEIYD
jgi:hypothetical protein